MDFIRLKSSEKWVGRWKMKISKGRHGSLLVAILSRVITYRFQIVSSSAVMYALTVSSCSSGGRILRQQQQKQQQLLSAAVSVVTFS